MTKREFHYQDAASSKFWRIARDGSTTVIQFGRIGSEGQTQTKTYPDEQAALLAHDRQIAEKFNKGYQEVGGEHASIAAPALSAQASSAPAVTAEPAQAPLPPLPASSADQSTRVELDPTDWLWATWRPWQPLEQPATPAFDKPDALRCLARVSNDVYQWRWNWERAEIPIVPSREEAHFWLTAMQSNNNARMTPRQIGGRSAI